MKDNKFYTLGEIEDKYIGKKGTPKRDKCEVDLQTDVHSHFIGEAIKQARLSKNMTQEELGSLIGVQRATNFSYREWKESNIFYHSKNF